MDLESHLDCMRNQKAVIWAKGAVDGFGNTAFGAGAEITVRWQDANVKFTTKTGEEKISRAIVYIDGSQAISLDDYLYKGTLSSLDSADLADPEGLDGAYLVQRIDNTVDVENDTTLIKVYL